MSIEQLPYVISAELELEVPEISDFIDRDKIDMVRDFVGRQLVGIGKAPLWVPADEIQGTLNRVKPTTELSVVSLDDRYTANADYYVGISRGVDENYDDAGYVPRRNYSDIDDQLDGIAEAGKEVVLVDDVVFSGDLVLWLDDKLKRRDIKIAAVLAGVGIRAGLEKIESAGIDVDAGRVFEKVDDELCERDLFMLPGSGRRLKGTDYNALYFDRNIGRAPQWASIPEDRVNDFYWCGVEGSRALLKDGVLCEDIGPFVGWLEKSYVDKWIGLVDVVEVLDEAGMWAYSSLTGVPPNV